MFEHTVPEVAALEQAVPGISALEEASFIRMVRRLGMYGKCLLFTSFRQLELGWSSEQIISMVNAILRDNMPCFTAAVFSGKSKSGDTTLNYALNQRDEDAFREMYGKHPLNGRVKLKTNSNGLSYPVRVSSPSLPNHSFALPHVRDALTKN